MKRFLIFLLVLSLVFPLAACQENPEGSIVIHKDMDNLISKAQQDDSSKVRAADIADEVAANFETYQTTLSDDDLGVTVNVNAKVDVPEVDSLNIYRVKQKPFSQEFVDKVRKALMGEKEIYMAQALTVRTKSDYEEDIKYSRELIRQEEEKMAAATEQDRTVGPQDNQYVISEEEFREMCQRNINAYQHDIDIVQESYEQAPEEVDLKNYPCDGQLHTNEELFALYPELYFESYYSFFANEEDLHLVADSSDGQYQALEVRNSEDRSNELSYSSCPERYISNGRYYGRLRNGWEDWVQNSTIPEDFLGDVVYDESTVFLPLENDETTITMEEALSTAEEFLAEIGFSDFTFSEGGLYNELANTLDYHGISPNTVYYRNYYILLFYRDIDGALLTQSSGEKIDWGDETDGYRTQSWPGEAVELRVNDQGIAGFNYFSPVEITETVVDSAALKPFAEIKDTFEKMICMVNADDQRVSWIDIDRVRLSYSRISEQDRFDTGLIVPVWSFEGKMDTASRGDEEIFVQQWKRGTIFAVNAIDGSIINGELGY